MFLSKRKGSHSKFSEGELRRFELLTSNKKEIAELDRVIEEKKLTRKDLGIILLYLGVRPGIDRSAFDIK